MSNRLSPQEDIFTEKSNFDFKQLTPKLIANWYWFVLSVILCLLFSFLYLRYTAPIYKTSARIFITSDKSASPGEDALAQAIGGQFSTANNVEGEAEILKTRHLMNKVVRDLKAYITYYHKGQVRSVDLYKSAPFKLVILGSPDSIRPVSLEVTLKGTRVTVFNDQYRKQVNLYEKFLLPGVGMVQIESGTEKPDEHAEYIVRVKRISDAVGDLMKPLEVSVPIKQVDIIALNYTNEVPEKSEDVITKLIQAYTNANLEDKNRIADSTIAFIDNRLVYVGQELGSVEGNVQNFKQKNRLTDITAQSGLLVTSSGEYAEQLAKVETQLSILNAVEKYLNSYSAGQRIVPNGTLLEDPNFSGLVERYNLLVMEKEKSSISKTEDNPYMQNLSNQIAAARTDMIASLSGLKKSLLISKENIQSKTNNLAGAAHKVPAVERTFLDLSRQQQIKQELYTFLLQKKEETAISKTSNVSNCKVIEPAVTAGQISPVKVNVMGYGLILGLFIPFGVIFMRDRLNNKIISKEQIRRYTRVSVIGEIGKNTFDPQNLVVAQGSRTPISEQFRALRTNLTFFLNEGEKTILLTSSMSGEGKSFISLNLAAVLAISGKRVVMMEMDLRKPSLSSKLKIKNDIGFTNYVVNKNLTEADVIKPSGVHENLFILGSGMLPPNPTEIILNPRLEALMTDLKEKFDYIIIDAPPIGMVTDAQLLGKYADLTLYIVRQGFTFNEQMEIVEDIYRDNKLNNISILMNDVKNTKGYGYGYGYGYGMEAEKKSIFSKIFNRD